MDLDTIEREKPDGTAKRARKRPKGAPTHVVELPLIVTEADRRVLDLRFKAAGILRNSCTAEALRRLGAMRVSPEYDTARKIPKGDAHRKERAATFGAIRVAFGFTKASMETFARGTRDRFWIKNHLGGHDTQTVAATAFAAVERHAFGRGGRPRFKRVGDLRSIASKDPLNIMRLKGDPLQGPSAMCFEYRGLGLRVRRRRFSDAELHALSLPALSFRVIRHRDGARNRYALQVVVDGPARVHRERHAGTVGLDLGPSTVAVVSATDVIVETLCPGVTQPWAEQRRLQRRIDRSFRAANPDCFREDGTFVSGKKPKGRSKTLDRLRRQNARRQAKLARRRRNEHGHLSNRILGGGTTVRTEVVSKAAYQRSFGRSVQVRAPGAFVALLKRKAEAAGGGIVGIPTWEAKLSQLDHVAGDHVRKPLSLRRHAMRDGSGVVVDRDAYSAFLALHCDACGVVDLQAARAHWSTGACERLAVASRDAERASGSGFPLPPAVEGRPRRSASPRTPAAPASGSDRKVRRGGEASGRSRGKLVPAELRAVGSS